MREYKLAEMKIGQGRDLEFETISGKNWKEAVRNRLGKHPSDVHSSAGYKIFNMNGKTWGLATS